MPATIECMANEGSPYPYIEKLHSYDIPYSYGQEGFIHFYGSYQILEKMEPTGTELDAYESSFCLPQTVTMIFKPNETDATEVYRIEIYKRVFKGDDQIVYFRIINTI
jgi:hypothetical protein